MNREAQILTALQGNITSEAKRALVDELNTIRSQASRRVAVAREVELGKEAASAHLTPAQPYVRHTTETDWLGKVASTRHTASEIHQMAKAEASRWFRQTSALARADVNELNIQAVGYAQVWSGQFGEALHVAQSSFLQAASHLAGVKLSADENDDPEEDQDDPEESYEEADDDDDGGNPFVDSKKESSRRRTAADGATSFCRLCGKQLQQMENIWYALRTSPEQRSVGEHYCVPARILGRPGEFGSDGLLVPGTPGGEGGQYDAPAGTIFDAGGNPVKVARRRTASISMDDIQRWCDRNGCVMKDFPDELIEEVANSGDLEQLGSYLEDIEAAEIGQYDNDDFRHTPDHDGFYGSRTAAEGMTCSVCGDKMTSTDGSYHHDNGEKHDHEAKPGKSAALADLTLGVCDICDGEIVLNSNVGYWLHVDNMGMSVSRDHEAEPLMMGGRPVRKGSSKTAASPDFTSYPKGRAPGQEWSTTCSVCGGTETGTDYYNGWPSQNAFHNHLFCGHDPDADYHQDLAIDRYSSLRTAASPDFTSYPKGRAPGQEWSTTCSVCGGTETGTDYYNGWPSQNAFHNHLFCGHDPDADYHQDLAIDRYSSLRTAATPTGRSDYKPGMSRVGEPTPQSDPDMFSSEDLLAEAKYLLKMNEKYGSHELRTMAVTKLIRIITDRGDVERLTPKSRKKAEANGIDSPSPDSQNGYAESTLPDVSVPSAPEDTNMGWIAEGDPNAVTGSMGVYEAMFMGKKAGLYPDENAKGVTTWADGFGNWHATADSPEEAKAAIMAELKARGEGGNGFRLKVVQVGPRHYTEDFPGREGSRTAAQEGWWPLAPDDRYPGENKLVCPACGSADVSISGNNLGRDIITNNLYTSLTCNSCGRRDILPEKPKDLRGASRKQAVGTSYYAIADDGPDNEMHEFAPGSADRTACGKHTEWCRAFPPSDAIYCPSCFGHEASRKHAEANGIDSPSPQSQNGYAETTLTDVSVGSAPDDTNLGWITDGDPNAEDEGSFDAPDNPIANEASINARFASLVTAGWSYDIFVPEMGTSMTEDGFASLEEADAAAKRAAGQYAGASGFLNDAGGNAYSWTSRSAARRTAGDNDKPAGAAPMVDQVTNDSSEDDIDMFGGEWVHEGLRHQAVLDWDFVDGLSPDEQAALVRTMGFSHPADLNDDDWTALFSSPGAASWASDYSSRYSSLRQAMHPDDDPSQGPGYLDDAPNLLGDPPGMDPEDYDMFAPEMPKTAMPAPADLGVSVGSIFYSSWGYDQTNVSFYEVVGLTGASVKVREVAKSFVSQNGPGGNKVIPQPGNYIGGEMTKRLRDSGYADAAITINSSETAWLWDGKPQYETDSAFGH